MSRRVGLALSLLGGRERGLCLILGVGGMSRGRREGEGGMWDLRGVRRLGRVDVEVRMGLHGGGDRN